MKRRWMWTLSVALVATSGLQAYSAEADRYESAAAAAIKKMGGRCYLLDESNPGSPVVSVNLSFTQVGDAGLEYLEGLTELRGLVLRRTQATDEGIEKLQRALPNCKIIR